MPSGRVVSGTFLEKLSLLKFPPDELMPRMVHACVMLQAVGPKDRENVGTTLTEANVKSLATSSKAKGLQANRMISKAYDIVSVVRDDNPQKKQFLLGVGDMAVELAKFIFLEDDTFESMDNISAKFVEQFYASESKGSHDDGDSADGAQTMFEYSNDGSSSNAGLFTVRNAGFKPNSLIEPKKTDPSIDEQYVIEYIIGDVSCGLRRILNDGTDDKK